MVNWTALAPRRRGGVGGRALREEARGAPAARLGRVSALVFAAACLGCVGKVLPPDACTRNDLGGCIIEDLDIVDNDAISDGDIEGRVATAETSRVLDGAIQGVPILSVWDSLAVEYELFDRFVLERDLARIERLYRSRGFYEAHARAGRVIRLSKKTVRVEIAVDEGPPIDTTVVQLDFIETDLQTNLAKYPHAKELQDAKVAVQDAVNALRAKPRFEEADYDELKRTITRSLTDRGFAYGSARGTVNIDIPQHTAAISLKIDVGPHCAFGDIQLVGLGEIPEAPIRAAINIDKGRPYSTDALESAEYALAEFGVFSAVEIKPQLSPEGEPVRGTEIPVKFTFQPALLRAMKAGFGAELGDRVEVHSVGGWDNRNFLGGLRRFNIEARPGLVFYPAKLSAPDQFSEVLPEVKLSFELTQPGFIESRTNGLLRGRFHLYQYRTGEDDCLVSDAGASIIGYREYAGTVGVERKFWKSQQSVGLFGHVQLDQPFSYNDVPPPEGFQEVVIPYLEAVLALDLRKNAQGKPEKISPTAGVYVATNVQAAFDLFKDAEGRGKGADDIRFQPELRAYVPISKRVTLAFRATSGFLLPRNYGDDLKQKQEADPGEAPPDPAALARDLQLLSFRGFFSGGVNSNRGYSYRGVGPHARLNSLFLETSNPDCRIPTGGQLLWESSLELRFPIAGALRSAFFLDGSDVTLGAFRLERPHLSAGFGLRYDTPVGPLRADVGYRIRCLQALDKACDEIPEDEGDPGDFLGLPIAISIAIGESF